MRIAIDASRATAAEPAGTENYSLHLIRALVDVAAGRPDLELELYAKAVLSGEMGDRNGYTTHVIPDGRGWTHLRLSAQMLRRRPDVLFVPAHVVPLIHPQRTVVTIHDLGYLQYPEAHPTVDRWYLDLSTRWNARSACRIITPSQATKIDVMNRLGVGGDLVEVIHSGVDPSILPVDDGARIEEVKSRHGIAGRVSADGWNRSSKKEYCGPAEGLRSPQERRSYQRKTCRRGKDGLEDRAVRVAGSGVGRSGRLGGICSAGRSARPL